MINVNLIDSEDLISLTKNGSTPYLVPLKKTNLLTKDTGYVVRAGIVSNRDLNHLRATGLLGRTILQKSLI